MLLPGSYKGTRRRAYWQPRSLEAIMGEIFKVDRRLLYFTAGEKRGNAMPTFTGRTEDSAAPILSAGFWTKGKKIFGVVARSFQTENGTCYTLKLPEAISVDRKLTYPKEEKTEKLDKVSVGSLKGFEMAVQASGVPGGKLLVGDKVHITCTGKSPSGKGSDQVNFQIEVNREAF